jgi:hypothetical protein
MVSGSVRTLDPAKLALETAIDNFLDIFGLEFFGVDLGIFFVRTVSVDGVEKLRKAAAVPYAQTAIGTQTEYAFGFRT